MKKTILFFRQNGLLFLLALFLAWMSWMLISAAVTETQEIELLVQILPAERVNPDLILIHAHRPKRVEVRISGSRRDMDRLDPAVLRATFRVRAEFLDESGAMQRRTFTAEDLELPDGIKLLEMTPPRVVAEFAERRRATVPVVVRTDTTRIPEDAGLELTGATAIPATVEIVGPVKLVGELEASGGIATESIPVQNHAPLEGQTEIDVRVPLGLAALERQGVRPEVSTVTVRLEFAHVYRMEDQWIPIEVHWVDPHPESNATCFEITDNIGRVEDRNGLKINVTLVGPRSVLEDTSVVTRIRAYVRSDEALAGIEKRVGVAPVHFAFLPRGVTVEDADTLQADVSPQKAFKLVPGE